MKKLTLLVATMTISHVSTALQLSNSEQELIEESAKVSVQIARCLDTLYSVFDSKEQEEEAYRKLYGALVEHQNTFLNVAIRHEESGMQKIVEYVGSKEILVGMLIQGVVTQASQLNKDAYESERNRLLNDYAEYVWRSNNCDAVISRM